MSLYQRAVALIISVSLSLTACTLSSPYGETGLTDAYRSQDTVLSEGMKHAQDVEHAYREKLAAQAKLGTHGGAALITLASVILGLATFDSHTDAIKGTALASGTGYYIGNWYANEAHELVYLRGIEAVVCATTAVSPINVPMATRDKLETDLKELDEAISGLIHAITALELRVGYGSTQNNENLIKALKAILSRAKQVHTGGSEMYSAGKVLLLQIDSANNDLIGAINAIDIAVDRALQQANPRLESLTNIVTQLSNSAAIFSPGLDIAGDLKQALDGQTAVSHFLPGNGNSRKKSKAEKKLARETRNGLEYSAMVIDGSRKVSDIVNVIGSKQPLEALENCGVNPEALANQLSISTGTVSLRAGEQSVARVVIDGGKKPYVATFLKSPTPGLDLRNPIPGDSLLEISASTDSKEGSYDVLVTDAAQNRVTLVVQISAAQ